jgi:hypothetical protein
MNLVHKSGFNESDSLRFSALLRFFDVAGSNFVPFDVFFRCDQNYIEKLTNLPPNHWLRQDDLLREHERK